MYTSADHPLVRLDQWRPEGSARWIADSVLMSPTNVNVYVVADEAGDVVINTGFAFQGARHRERFEQLLGRPLTVKTIVFTQSHPNHIGGWSAFQGPGTETIAQEAFADCRADRTQLDRFYPPRSRRIVGDLVPPAQRGTWFLDMEEPVISRTFATVDAFEVGRRRFELYSTPGGETLDSLVVWLPAERMAFCSNLMGALFGALPNLYTLRGDRLRSARQFLRSVDELLALEPEMLMTGHGEPIVGWDTIRERVQKVRDAVRYIQDETIKGMNQGKSLFGLMDEIELPAHLRPSPGRGPVRWYVRAVWEEYTGWFRMESTTELYAVPQRAIWPELVEQAGAPALIAKARTHLDGGRPLEAMHYLDMLLSVDPSDAAARDAKRAALLALLERTGGEAHDEMTWLESELGSLGEPPQP
jgi:alkyl sulfatase BDS1-like metallo-beta-lactamase superfamily hydrolase